MNTITAIDTVYKGYHFRSRLEARWALFFDLSGVTWRYEVEPLNVNGEAYLPDFQLNFPGFHQSLYMEVKPNTGNGFRWPGVYLAGKCSKEHEWRGDAADGGDWNSENSDWEQVEKFVTMNGASFLKCGPFSANCHGYRDDSPHSMGVFKSTIVEQCRRAIGRANLFCAHISTMDAFGTLVEIGFARALYGVPISLTITEEVIWKGRFRDEVRTEWQKNFPEHDLWFVEHMAGGSPRSQTARVKDDIEARAFHAEFIRNNTPREIRLIAGLAAQHGSVSIVFGDPFEITAGGGCLWNGFNVPRFVKTNLRHAEAARAYRFDKR